MAPTTKASSFAAPDELYRDILSELTRDELHLLETGVAAHGHRLLDPAGDRIGTVAAVFAERETGRPRWLAVHLPRTRRESFVGMPVGGVTINGGQVWTTLEAKLVRSGPIVPIPFMSARIEQSLCRYYRLPPTTGASAGRWERRATCARVTDRLADGTLIWLPAPRERLDAWNREQETGPRFEESVTEHGAPYAAAPASLLATA